jgi:hypothetical protein
MVLNRNINSERARDARDRDQGVETLSPYCLQPHAAPKLGSDGIVALGIVPQDFASHFERLNSKRTGGAEVLIPDTTTPGGHLRLRDEQGVPIIREANESSRDAYVRATRAVLAYIDDGRLEDKNGTLSPTEKFFERKTEEPSVAAQRQSWDVRQMYASNLATIHAAKQSQTQEIANSPTV